MDYDTATLASVRTEATLVPTERVHSVNHLSAADEGPIRLDFSYDNPSNTTIFDPVGAALYFVKTTYDPRTTTVLRKIISHDDGTSEQGEELFRLEWHDVLSDKISVRGAPFIYFTSLVSPLHVLSRTRRFSFDGKVYRWANLSDMEGPQLLAEGSETPIARFRTGRKPLPARIQAKLVNPLPARPASLFVGPEVITVPGLLDMILITFLPMEKSRRIHNTSARNKMHGLMYGNGMI